MDHSQISVPLLGLAAVFAGVVLVISVAVVWRKSKWYEDFVNITARKPWIYSNAEMENMLHQAGFDTVKVKTQWGAHQICFASKP